MTHLSDMHVGTCAHCKQPVTEADSWAHDGHDMGGYPPTVAVCHSECKAKALLEAAEAAEREKERVYADDHGFFWLPCPNCRRMFGGHETPRGGSFWPADSTQNSRVCCLRCPGQYGSVPPWFLGSVES
jgi:hypothetical protein